MLGVSGALLGWIFGSASKTFDALSYIPRQIELKEGSEYGGLLGLVFLACFWNLVEILRQIPSAHPTQHPILSTKAGSG